MATHVLALIVLLACVTSVYTSAGLSVATVYVNGGVPTIKPVYDTSGVACAQFNDTIDINGWSTLHVWTNPSYNDTLQAYYAGYVEGYITQERIFQFYEDIRPLTFSGTHLPDTVEQWAETNDEWVASKVAENPSDSYWGQVSNIRQQFLGLGAGYNLTAPANNETLNWAAMWTIQSNSDIGDIEAALSQDRETEHGWSHLSAKESQERFLSKFKCSSLVKVTGNMTDMYSAHTTWFFYGSMLRTYKYYELNFQDSNNNASTVGFSSYPGQLTSVDDYYQMNNGLTSMETSFSVFNMSIYDAVNTSSLLYWYRVMLANRIASTGPEWASVFSRYNSGTYNNQWIVVDYNQFEPKVGLKDNALWIVEQLPGIIESGDMTDILRYGYWPSYNIPFFENIFKLAGYGPMAESDPVMLDYSTCCRANIFRRDQASISTLEDMQHMMQYNDWENDPFSLGNAGYAISSRFDLSTENPFLLGGIDSKITSNTLMKTMETVAISGPTQQQAVFTWDDPKWATNETHIAMPTTWDFPWVTMSPINPSQHE